MHNSLAPSLLAICSWRTDVVVSPKPTGLRTDGGVALCRPGRSDRTAVDWQLLVWRELKICDDGDEVLGAIHTVKDGLRRRAPACVLFLGVAYVLR